MVASEWHPGGHLCQDLAVARVMQSPCAPAPLLVSAQVVVKALWPPHPVSEVAACSVGSQEAPHSTGHDYSQFSVIGGICRGIPACRSGGFDLHHLPETQNTAVISNYAKGQSGLDLASRRPQPTQGNSCRRGRLGPGLGEDGTEDSSAEAWGLREQL